MARDPRKGSAFESGMRGRQKPKIGSNKGGTYGQEDEGNAGGENKQGPDTQVGNPDGVGLSAYTSGMRGPEKPKQKPASGAANYGQEREGVSGGDGTSRQGPDTFVGRPDAHNDAGTGPRKGVADSQLRTAAHSAYGLGNTGSDNNTEDSAMGEPGIGDPGILCEEDDNHINIRIPKSSMKKKQSGVHSA